LRQPASDSVLGCGSSITELAATLRSPTPVSAEGVARLRSLLSWGSSPAYRDAASDELECALQQIAALALTPDRRQ
jgi:hypothetical protein